MPPIPELTNAVGGAVTIGGGCMRAQVHCLLGMPVDGVTEIEAAELVRAAVRERKRLILTTPNLNFAVGCRQDAAFRDSVLQSDLVVADGMPLVWIARLLRIPIPERVAGASLFERLRQSSPAMDQPPLRVFFFGGPPGAAEAACLTLNAAQGGMVGVGWCDPGFADVEAMSAETLLERINASGADFLVVALGAAKGQAWIMRNAARLNVPVISHLGAVVNFTAGTLSRAPRWVQTSGLEWLWRIKEEPALWWRYVRDATALVTILAREVLPCWWFSAGPARREGAGGAAQVVLTSDEHGTAIALRGDWSCAPAALLQQLVATADAPEPLRIELSGVENGDSAWVGTLLVLYGACRQNGKRLQILARGGRVAKLIAQFGAGFLLEQKST